MTRHHLDNYSERPFLSLRTRSQFSVTTAVTQWEQDIRKFYVLYSGLHNMYSSISVDVLKQLGMAPKRQTTLSLEIIRHNLRCIRKALTQRTLSVDARLIALHVFFRGTKEDLNVTTLVLFRLETSYHHYLVFHVSHQVLNCRSGLTESLFQRLQIRCPNISSSQQIQVTERITSVVLNAQEQTILLYEIMCATCDTAEKEAPQIKLWAISSTLMWCHHRYLPMDGLETSTTNQNYFLFSDTSNERAFQEVFARWN